MAEINTTQTEINSELNKVKTPKLSLDAEDRTVDTGYAIPSIEAMSVPQYSNIAAGSMNESMLSEEERKQIDEFCKQIYVTEVKLLNS